MKYFSHMIHDPAVGCSAHLRSDSKAFHPLSLERSLRHRDCIGRGVREKNLENRYDSHEILGPARTLVKKRSDSGFLVLSSSLQVLHWDTRAWELCQKITVRVNGHSAANVLPLSVVAFAREIVKLMEIRSLPNDWERFQLRRVITNGEDPIFLSGIGLPDPIGDDDSRVLLILEEIRRKQGFSLEEAQERFQLTMRETQVVEHLLKGCTNKEIASAIAISEQTVKEHIKHIMKKTKTTTRTGILAAVFNG
jgi:DNA-binding CsgD family transcriptional regulator